MAVATYKSNPKFPRKLNVREAKVVEAARDGLQSASLASGKLLVGSSAGVATAQTISGAVAISNAGVASLPLADGKVLIGSAGGVAAAQSVTGIVAMTNGGVTSIALADGKMLVGGVDNKAAAQTLTGDVTVSNAGVTAIGAGKVVASMLASGVAASHVIKFVKLGSEITTTVLVGLVVDDLVIRITSAGACTAKPCTVADTLPEDPDDTDYIIVIRAVA